MTETKTIDARQPNVVKLREKFHELQAKGLTDVKFWYVGPAGFGPAKNDDVTVDDLAADVLQMFNTFEQRDFVDISHKLK